MRHVTFEFALTLALALLLALLTAAGCGKTPQPEAAGVRLPQVNDAFLAAGFKLDAFKPIDARRFQAQTCAEGPLDGVDTLVCEYASPDAAALAKKSSEGWIAESVTGAVLANGRTLLAVADRARVDPNGKVIHRITQAYQRTH
ncbi:MAG TPA: hypothetical protein VFF06_35930 [Polyangia bacterium]|nr:hypothetical protein [Polyangia bacterium]